MRYFVKDDNAFENLLWILMIFYGWGTLAFFLVIGVVICCCSSSLTGFSVVLVTLIYLVKGKQNS